VLIPVLAGDEVLVTSTLRLFAFDARTAEPRWSAGPPAGWDAPPQEVRDEAFEGLDAPHLWIAPAAGARVAVAALQVPLLKSAPDWRDNRFVAAPERRLFAFELASGRPLWDHAPALTGDDTSGGFPQRMSVMGSPTIAGDRVLVACTLRRRWWSRRAIA